MDAEKGRFSSESLEQAELEYKEGALELVAGSRTQKGSRGKTLCLDKTSITVIAFKENRPVYVPDVRDDRRYVLPAQESSIKSEFAVPIFKEGETNGVLNLEDDELNSFSERDRDVVTILSAEVDVALRDLDDFKQINDNYSHLVGDQVLKKISEVLSATTRGADTLVRYGGDEFLIFMPEFEDNLANVIKRIKTKIKEWNRCSGLIEEKLGLTTGTAVWDSPEARDIKVALKKADNRMYENKKAKKDNPRN